MKAVLVCLWVLSAGALADPVPLFAPGPAIAPDDPIHAESKRMSEFKAAHPIVLNSAAFGANVVTVEVKGRLHTFVMHKSQTDWTPISAWEGEEEDDTYSRRPYIILRSWTQGRAGFSGEFFLPPRSFFAIRAGEPTILIEAEGEFDVHRGPGWIIWLRLAGILILLGCLVGVSGTFAWRWVKSLKSTFASAAPGQS